MHQKNHEEHGIDIPVLIGTLVPLIGFGIAVYFSWGRSLNLTSLTLLVVGFLITGCGITVGYHRLFTHRAFEATPFIRYMLAIFGLMAFEGKIVDWVTDHRIHHNHSDEEGDPHSPVFNRNGLWQRVAGFIHAHYGWIIRATDPRDHKRYVNDLLQEKTLMRIDRLFLLWVALGLLIPTVIGGLVSGTWHGALMGFIWGGLVRIFLVHHATWSVNSVCHVFGSQPFQSDDSSRNNVIAGIVGMGEGWHNTHHAFPYSARHGLKWWQVDLSWYFIKILEKCHLIRNVRLPTEEQIKRKLNQ